MMQPNIFQDDLGADSGIPMFGKNGTALSSEERAQIAKRKGLCLRCGTKTHIVKVFQRTPLTNNDVYKGFCIRCEGDSVPPNILSEWTSRNAMAAPPGRSAGPGPGAPPGRFHHTAKQVRHANTLMRPARPGGPLNSSDGAGRTQAPLQRKHSTGMSHSGSNHADMAGSHHRARSSGNAPSRSASAMPSYGGPRLKPPSSKTQGQHHFLDAEEYKTSKEEDSWTLMKDLKDNRDKPDILRTKLHGFRNLADDQAGAMYEIKDVMDMYRSDSRFMMVAMGAVWGICSKNDDKKQEAGDTGCLELVLDSLRNGKTKDNPEAVHWALGTISSLAVLNENKRLIAEKGGIECMLDALNTHQTNPSVFEWGCRALHAMIYNASDNEARASIVHDFERDMMTIEDQSGIQIISSAMKHHVSECVAQAWAFKLLFRLQDRQNPNSSERVAKTMKEEEIISTCIKIMKARSTTPDLFEQAAETLSVLLVCPNNQIAHHKVADCIPSVIRFMGEHSSNLALQESCARLLATYATGNNQAKQVITEAGGVRSLLDSMINSPDDCDLACAVMTLLWVLSSDPASFDLSILPLTKQAIEAVSQHVPDNEGFSEGFNDATCGFVANIVSGVAQGRGDDIPVDMVLRLATEGGAISGQAGRALSVVLGKFPEAVDQMLGDGLCNRLLADLCDSDVEVQASSSAALAAITASSETARHAVFESGGLATVSAALLTTVSESLVVNLLQLVSALVTSGTKKVLQLPNEFIQTILHVMNNFSSANKTACSTIRNAMLVTVPGFNSVSCDGLADALVGILDDPASPDDLLIEACGAIWAYTAKQTLPNTSVGSQLFRSVLGLCGKSKGENAFFNSPVLTEASGALGGIMRCIIDSPVHIPDNDIDLIVSILDLVIECDVENVVLMERMLDIMLTLCVLTKELLIQFGAIVVVIDCMVEHEANEVIQQKGCAILALIASTENLQVNLSIAETDGIDMIVSALANFTENATIQTDACRALSHLSIDHESRMLIASQGGLILLVNAMNKFRTDVDLLEAACSALLNLSSDAEEQVLAGSSVIETVIGVMHEQVLSSRLHEKSLGVLQNVSMRSKDAKKAIADAGGIGAVAFAIKEFMGSPAVLERAYTTMWSLAVLEENQIRIANEGGISLVVNGMMANITYEKVQKQACGCLCTLSSNSRNKSLIRDLGGVDSIVYAMWAHYNSDSLLIEACRALSSLAVNVQTNEVMIATDGEISAIMSAMRRFPNSEKLQEHACVALRNFLLSADNAALVRFQAEELETLMNGAATRFPDRCAERARQVLASIR